METVQGLGMRRPPLSQEGAEALKVGHLIGLADPAEKADGTDQLLREANADSPLLACPFSAVGGMSQELKGPIGDPRDGMGAGGNAFSLQGRQKVGKECILQGTDQSVTPPTEGGKLLLFHQHKALCILAVAGALDRRFIGCIVLLDLGICGLIFIDRLSNVTVGAGMVHEPVSQATAAPSEFSAFELELNALVRRHFPHWGARDLLGDK